MKETPYNNGKVKIGDAVYLNKLANPPYIERDEDMLELQSYLIHDPRVLNKEYWLSWESRPGRYKTILARWPSPKPQSQPD